MRLNDGDNAVLYTVCENGVYAVYAFKELWENRGRVIALPGKGCV